LLVDKTSVAAAASLVATPSGLRREWDDERTSESVLKNGPDH